MAGSILVSLALCSLFLLWRAECSVVLISASNYSLPFPDLEASFAPRIPAIGIMGRLFASEPLNGCEPLKSMNDDHISGFLLLERGDCNFVTKVKHAQDAGYAAAIVYNDEDNEDLITMSGSGTGIEIYAVFISKKAGKILHSIIDETDSICYLLPPFENAAKSLVAISFISLLTVLAIFSTLFFVRRRRYRRSNSMAQESEARGMTWKDVKTLTEVLYGDGIAKFSTTCAICLEDYRQGERLRILPCGHEFHAPCIDQWLTTHRCFCPICKTDAHLKTPHKVPSEHTPLLASCTPSFNTMGSGGTISAQNEQFIPCSRRNWQSPPSTMSQFCQEDAELMQFLSHTPESFTSSTTRSCSSLPEMSASDTQEVDILINSE